jgi:HEAT repeat protein
MATDIDKKIEFLMGGDEYEGLGELVKLGKKATPKLTAILADHSDPLMLKRAAVALGRIRDKTAVKPLVNSLADKDVTVVLSAIDALAFLRDKKVSRDIAGLLKNKDPSVRVRAARALGALRDKKSMASLEELSEKDEHDFVRREASDALAKLRIP